MELNRITELANSQPTDSSPDLDFTGERLVPGKTPPALFREHEERYVFAGQFVSGKHVLDVACGTGIGTSFLKQAGAQKAWGVDIASDAIAFAAAKYQDCEFFECEASRLCFPDESVDVVVSFETLEHLSDQHRFLSECRRVLRPGGLMICSTPNRAIFRWQPNNRYHTRELTPREFVSLLKTQFAEPRLFSQSEMIYPWYVISRLASPLSGTVKLRSRLRTILGSDSSDTSRPHSFRTTANCSIRPYRSSRVIQPAYVIALGRKMQ